MYCVDALTITRHYLNHYFNFYLVHLMIMLSVILLVTNLALLTLPFFTRSIDVPLPSIHSALMICLMPMLVIIMAALLIDVHRCLAVVIYLSPMIMRLTHSYMVFFTRLAPDLVVV
jgi:hypothetical protein